MPVAEQAFLDSHAVAKEINDTRPNKERLLSSK